ncbi:hypothetical protein TeGR_g14302, partial [Tetraparma gracilis]
GIECSRVFGSTAAGAEAGYGAVRRSAAMKDAGRFVGLLLDQGNQQGMTGARVEGWVRGLEGDGFFE